MVITSHSLFVGELRATSEKFKDAQEVENNAGGSDVFRPPIIQNQADEAGKEK